ncbi:MAG: PQQ-binding-like beta-propeller repeat protein [Alphaproteobacteria bacterium]|nr:PQQ-binding-like beta-propeller repeat protein [Alphaproteobacteria bacterium]
MTIIAIVALSLSSCDYIKEVTGQKEVPLPGQRISVMLNEGELQADPRVSDLRVLLPTPRENPNWTQAGGNATHAMHHLKIRNTVVEDWDQSIGEGSSDERRLVARPVVADGYVFTMDAEFEVNAFEISTGKQVWNYDPNVPEEDEETFGGGLAYEGGRVFMSTGFGKIIALRADNGAELWRRNLPGPSRSSPTVGGGRVFAVTIDNQTVAFNEESGKKLWTHSGISESAGLLGGGSPALVGNTVISPYSSGELVALRVTNGRVVWSDSLVAVRRTDTLSTVAHIRGHPVVDRGVVYAISHSGRLVAIDLRTGARVWDRSIGGSETPWVAGNFIYVLSNQGDLYCLTRLGGRVRWVQSLPKYEDPEDKDGPIKWFGPVLASDRLMVVGNHGEVLSVSPYTGAFLSKLELTDELSVAPVVASGSVFFLSDDADLIVYR